MRRAKPYWAHCLKCMWKKSCPLGSAQLVWRARLSMSVCALPQPVHSGISGIGPAQNAQRRFAEPTIDNNTHTYIHHRPGGGNVCGWNGAVLVQSYQTRGGLNNNVRAFAVAANVCVWCGGATIIVSFSVHFFFLRTFFFCSIASVHFIHSSVCFFFSLYFSFSHHFISRGLYL